MRRSRDLLFLVLALWLPVPLSSCPADAFDGLFPNPFYPAAKRAALAKLQVKDPTITDVEVIETPNGSFTIKLVRGRVSQSLGGATFDPDAVDERLAYDVGVPLKYRNSGLNRLFVAYYLDKHPEIKVTRSSFMDSNKDAFFRRVLHPEGHIPVLQSRLSAPLVTAALKKIVSARSPSEIRDLRALFERAAREDTAEGKVQASLGFSRIERIVVSYTSKHELGSVEVDFARGESVPLSELKVFVAEFNSEDSIRGETVEYRELLPDGNTKPGRGVVSPY